MANTEEALSISDFATLANISRKTLIYYDSIGLLCPDHIGDHGYRYYTRRQIDTAMVINVLAEMGMNLDRIKEFLKNRKSLNELDALHGFDDVGPASVLPVFEDLDALLKQQIKHYDSLREAALLRLSLFREGTRVMSEMRNGAQTICTQPKVVKREIETPLFLSKEVNCSRQEASDIVIVEYYNRRLKNSVPLGCPGGFIVSQESLKNRNTSPISHLYFLMQGRGLTGEVIPAGYSVVCYIKESYCELDKAYTDLFEYLEENELEVCGNAYEECLLDGLTSMDAKNYLTRISLQVDLSDRINKDDIQAF